MAVSRPRGEWVELAELSVHVTREIMEGKEKLKRRGGAWCTSERPGPCKCKVVSVCLYVGAAIYLASTRLHISIHADSAFMKIHNYVCICGASM